MDIMKHLDTISLLLGATSSFGLFLIFGEPFWVEWWMIRVLIIFLSMTVLGVAWHIIIERIVRGSASKEVS